MSYVAATAASNLALAQAEEARQIACQSYMQNYQSSGATVDQMRQYASCVYTLYGDGSSSISYWCALFVLASALTYGPLLICRRFLSSRRFLIREDWEDSIILSLLGLIVLWLLAGGTALVVWALQVALF